MGNRDLLILLIISLVVTPVFPQTKVVLNGTPSVLTTSTADGSVDVEQDESKQKEFRVLITKVGQEYIWETRERTRLVYRQSGAFNYFIDPEGSGYVKVLDQDFLPVSSRLDPQARFVYFEHLSLWLTTTTYWGTADTFEPAGSDASLGSESSLVVRDPEDRLWQSFVYLDGVANAVSSKAIMSSAGPVFTTEEECVSWSAQEAGKYPGAGYQCGYNCTYRKDFGEIICEGLAGTKAEP